MNCDALQSSFRTCLFKQATEVIHNDLVPENVWRRSDMPCCLTEPHAPFHM